MPAFPTKANLSHYSKLSISSFRDSLRKSPSDAFDADYSFRGKPYQYKIRVEKTACNFGGVRHWFICPSCDSKTSVLYCAGIYICRRCTNASYGSQLEQPIDNIFRRLNAIRARLGWQRGIANGDGQRPKGMHQTTYRRILNDYDQLMTRLVGAHRKMLNK